jgi:5-methylcytosine-specific restriction protein A
MKSAAGKPPLFRAPLDLRRGTPIPKKTDPIYLSPQYRQWRELVIQRSGRRCEWVEDGQRCTRAEPDRKLVADHIVELRDGGAPFDPMNGMALCWSHHTSKTNAARAARFQRRGGGSTF